MSFKMDPSPVSKPILEGYLRDPDQNLFVEHNTTLLRGEIHIEKLQEALQTVVGRHDALRTSFTFEESTGDIMAVVHDACDAPMILVRHISQQDIRSSVQACFSAALPHDKPPLLRVTVLFVTGTDSAYVVVSASHAIMDGTSSPLFNRELCAAYRGDPLEDVGQQYSQFARWQWDCLQSSRETAESMFGSRFRRIQTPLKFGRRKDANPYMDAVRYYTKLLKHVRRMAYPLDFPRPDDRSVICQAGSVSMSLNSWTFTCFEECMRLWGYHMSTWWCLVLAGVLHMFRVFSGSPETYLLVPRTTRPPEMRSVIGHFANDAPICLGERDRVDSMTLKELVIHLYQQLGRAAQHAPNIMSEDILNVCLRDSRRSGATRHLPEQCAFTAIEQEWLQLPLTDRCEPQEEMISLEKAYEDFYIRAFRSPDGLKVSMVYNARLFTEHTARSMLGVAMETVAEWVRSPEKRLKELRVFSYTSCHSYWGACRKHLGTIDAVAPGPILFSGCTARVPVGCRLTNLPFERTDALLAALIFTSNHGTSHHKWAVCCVTQDATQRDRGPRLHLVDASSLEQLSKVPAEQLVRSVSKLRGEAYENAVFSYYQQLELAGSSKNLMAFCVVPGEVSADYVLGLDAGIQLCVYVDSDSNIRAKYNGDMLAEDEVEGALKSMAIVMESVVSMPKQPVPHQLVCSTRLRLSRRLKSMMSMQLL